jgi:putative phosphoesterase
VRIAVLADVHGNLVALEAVLRDIAWRGAEGILHLGDLVGCGPNPGEVVGRVRAEGISGVMGDHDLVLGDPDPGDRWKLDPTAPAPDLGLRSCSRVRSRMGAEALSYLRSLPARLEIAEGSTVFLFTHASPASPFEPLSDRTPEERLRAVFEATGAHVMVVGHTHLPGARALEDRIILNPGSVGMPRGGDPRASYLMLDTENGLVAEHIRVEFGVETTARQSVTSGLPVEPAEVLPLGHKV